MPNQETRISKVGVGFAFSPRLEALLAEAKRICRSLDSKLLLIHAGESNPNEKKQLTALLNKLRIEENEVELFWESGKAEKVIRRICLGEKVDLLLLGAMKHEAMLTYYLGSVARRLSRNPPCSLLLITEPNYKSTDLRHVVINGLDHPKTPGTIKEGLRIAKRFRSKEVSIVEEVRPDQLKVRIEDEESLAKAVEERKRLQEEENKRVRDLIKPFREVYDQKIRMQCIFGKPGYSIGHFAEVKKADLLIVNSHDKNLGFLDKFFPHDLEYILSDLPCDLLIMHSDNLYAN
ncbi:MAG: universal stress protein [Vicingaceae bacterium]